MTVSDEVEEKCRVAFYDATETLSEARTSCEVEMQGYLDEVERLRGLVAELKAGSCAVERLKIKDLEDDLRVLRERYQRFHNWAKAVANDATFHHLMTGEDK